MRYREVRVGRADAFIAMFVYNLDIHILSIVHAIIVIIINVHAR